MNFRFQISDFKRRRLIFNCKVPGEKALLLFTFCFLIFNFFGCSIPNLEKPECTQARLAVKEFYSFHFDDNMQPSEEYLKKREKFLTDDWKFFISKNLGEKRDYFTLTEDYPKTFRIGGCEIVEPNRTVFQVVFFWKDDTRSEQRETKVEAVKQNDKWLINKIF